ncbi:MAG TPA: hypothetical protein VGU25_12445 [Acidobacteriaceae bacterium]|nr:hypothetical protein [Acidobacteriaceae bacterium]
MLKRLVAIVSTLLIAGTLAGCSANFVPSEVTPEQTPIGVIQGGVHGGNFPVVGAQIYLFAAGQGGYNTSATSLITSGKSGVSCSSPVVSNACYVTTDANGNFAVGPDYTCTVGQQVYMVAVAGNPGLTGSTTTATFATNSSTITVASVTGISIGSTASGTGVSGTVTAVNGTTVTLSNKTTAAGTNVSVKFSVYNTGAVQMAALGQCPASGTMASQVPYLVINEVTTVAFAYSVSGFATNAYNVSSDASGETAIAAAFANANNIVTLANGLANATIPGNANSIAPQQKINELANILSTCVNTQPVSPTQASTQCTQLFAAATTSGGTKATDEANAIFNIAHNQAQNVATIWNLGGSTGPFGPVGSQPTDWTMPVIYKSVISTPSTSSPIVSGPYNMAFDASGNAWIGDRVNGVVEIGALGAVTTYSNSKYGFKMVKGVAVSPQDGSIWISDFGNSDVYVMGSAGAHLATITTHLTGNGPVLTAFALNPAGGNYLAYEVTETTTGIASYDAGTYASVHFANNTNYTNVSNPGWLAADNTGSVWFPSTNTTYIGGLTVNNNNGTVRYGVSEPNMGATYQTVAEAEGAAADGLGNIWAPSGAGLYAVNTGTLTGAYANGGMNNPSKTFVDGSNVVWVASAGANTVSALNVSTGNWLATNGFSTDAPGGTGCAVIGVDPAGNVWSGNSDQSVTELLGLGTPTASPMYAGMTTITGTGRTAVTTVTKGNLGIEP